MNGISLFCRELKLKEKLSILVFRRLFSHGFLLDWQVCCFGALGFLCWMTQAAIAGYWAATAHDRNDIRDPHYVAWHSGKFAVRGLSTAFLMYLFTMVNAQAFPRQNPEMENNDFVVPFIMLGVLSTFIETLVDQYVGTIDSTIRFVLINIIR